MTNRALHRLVTCGLALVGLGILSAAGDSAATVPTMNCPASSTNPCIASITPSNDGSPCKITYRPSGFECNDGNACTFGETCNGAGTCGVWRSAPSAGTVNCTTTPADVAACNVRSCNGTSQCAVSGAPAGGVCTSTGATYPGYCGSPGMGCVTPKPKSVTFNTADAYPGQKVTGTVTLTAPAAAGGLVVPISSNDYNVFGSIPTYALLQTSSSPALYPFSVTVPAGATSATFQWWLAYTEGVLDQSWCAWATADATTKGCFNGHYRDQVGLPLITFATSKPDAHPGETLTITYTLDSPAPSAGYPIVLQIFPDGTSPGGISYSTNCHGLPSVNGPSSITVAPGATQASATVTVSPTSTCGRVNVQAGVIVKGSSMVSSGGAPAPGVSAYSFDVITSPYHD